MVQSLGKGADGEDLVADENQRLRDEESEEPLYELGLSPGSKRRDNASDNSTGLEKEMGRLFVGDGKSRYVSNSFWANLTTEVGLLIRSVHLFYSVGSITQDLSQFYVYSLFCSSILIDGEID